MLIIHKNCKKNQKKILSLHKTQKIKLCSNKTVYMYLMLTALCPKEACNAACCRPLGNAMVNPTWARSPQGGCWVGGDDCVLLIIQVSVSIWTGAWELERVQAINIYPLHSGQEGGRVSCSKA